MGSNNRVAVQPSIIGKVQIWGGKIQWGGWKFQASLSKHDKCAVLAPIRPNFDQKFL